jgi:hypothetical protein
MSGCDERRNYRRYKESGVLGGEKDVRLNAFTDSQLNESKILARSLKGENAK